MRRGGDLAGAAGVVQLGDPLGDEAMVGAERPHQQPRLRGSGGHRVERAVGGRQVSEQPIGTERHEPILRGLPMGRRQVQLGRQDDLRSEVGEHLGIEIPQNRLGPLRRVRAGALNVDLGRRRHDLPSCPATTRRAASLAVDHSNTICTSVFSVN